MGIQGLLPLLKDIQVNTSISSFSGLTVGIDAYCWLHKGGYSCAKDLVLGKPTSAYVDYIMRRVNMLISHNVTPILVFDGGDLPAKAGTEEARRKRRKEARTRGLAALKEGKTKEAFDQFQRCFNVTPEMAGKVIEQCYAINVQCVVAPYEADAQLAYLMKQGITQLTISEDSDLLLYGCNKVMYKMTIDGEGLVIDLENLKNVRTVQLSSFTLEKFRHMCMLSGCDYLPSIKGMGLIKAFRAIRRYSDVFQCIRSLKCDPSYSVSKDYEENFRKADLVFKYQMVFDLKSKLLIRLNPIDASDQLSPADMNYAGPEMNCDRGLQIALGNMNPFSGEVLASLPDFASGKIGKTAHKSTSWTSPSQNAPPNPRKSSALTQKHKPLESRKTQRVIEHSATAKSPVTPEAKADNSLKRLRDFDVSPTREEKIRKLYDNENEERVECAISTAVEQRHHSVFGKKVSKQRNPFKQNNKESSPVVISRFFSKKISDGKENLVTEDKDISDEDIVITENYECSEKTQVKGSLLDYLDKTNVRTTPVSKEILKLDNSIRSKPKKTNSISSIDRVKHTNMFSISNNECKNISLTKDRSHPSGDVDFNIAVQLDDDDHDHENDSSFKHVVNSFRSGKKAANGENKVSLKLGLCKKDKKYTSIKPLLSHFKCKPKKSIFSLEDSKDNMSKIESSEENIMQCEGFSADEIVYVSEEPLPTHLRNLNCNRIMPNDTVDSDDINLSEDPLPSCLNISPRDEERGNNNGGDHPTTYEISKNPEEKLPLLLKPCSINNKKHNDCKTQIFKVSDRIFDLSEEPLPSHVQSCDNADEEKAMNDDLSDNTELVDSGFISDLSEEPLPSILQNFDNAVEKEKIYSDSGNTGLAEGENRIAPEIICLDEEPLPFHLKKQSGEKTEEPVARGNKMSKSRHCQPMGLSKKRKSLNKSKNNDNLKQLTFDKFAFKKKTVLKSDAVVCIS